MNEPTALRIATALENLARPSNRIIKEFGYNKEKKLFLISVMPGVIIEGKTPSEVCDKFDAIWENGLTEPDPSTTA